ncbi:MAG: DUF4331 family protein [Myxococcales bacterium]|nr:DUF4331 family protein [Myxococcales bacterium]
MRTKNNWITALGATALCAAALQLNPKEVTAADHLDAPATQADAAVDIADFYAWPNEDGSRITAVITFAGLMPAGGDPVYDGSVLYTIHIDNTADPAENADIFDNDNDNESDIRIHARFGSNNAGDWGVQLIGLPGAGEDPLVGPVEEVLSSGSASAWAGMRDDPFFFDLDAFFATRDNLLDDADPADVAFIPGMAVDSIAGTNAMAIVVEFDSADVLGGNPDNFLQLWATTAVTP